MVEVPVLTGLNVYNPSDVHLLLLSKAPVVYMGPGNGRFKEGFYQKKYLIGPIILEDGSVGYNVAITDFRIKSLKFNYDWVNIPAHGNNRKLQKPVVTPVIPLIGHLSYEVKNASDLRMAKTIAGIKARGELKAVIERHPDKIPPIVGKLFTYNGKCYKVDILIKGVDDITIGEASEIGPL